MSKGHAADPAFKLEKPRVSRLLELYCETAPERIMRLKPDREELRAMAGTSPPARLAGLAAAM